MKEKTTRILAVLILLIAAPIIFYMLIGVYQDTELQKPILSSIPRHSK